MRKFFFLLLIVSTSAFGEWTKTGIGDDSSMFIDMSTIKRAGDFVRVTYLQNIPLGTTTDDGKRTYKSSKTVQEFNCMKNESRTLSFEWFSDVMGGGKRVYKDIHTYPYYKVDSDSLVGTVMKKVCQ